MIPGVAAWSATAPSLRLADPYHPSRGQCPLGCLCPPVSPTGCQVPGGPSDPLVKAATPIMLHAPGWVPLEQGPQGNSAPRGHLAVSGDSSGCQAWGWGDSHCQNAAKILQCTRGSPPRRIKSKAGEAGTRLTLEQGRWGPAGSTAVMHRSGGLDRQIQSLSVEWVFQGPPHTQQ